MTDAAAATAAVRDALARIRVLPVIVIDDAASARGVAEALRDGGVGCAEVTLRTPGGLDALAEMTEVDDFLVGAGTVLTADQARAAAAAGSRFAVSPGFDAELVSHISAAGMLPIPGVATAGEVMAAMSIGLRTLKLFPARQLGGAGMIGALRGPFPDVEFVPSGGVDIDNAAEYLIDGVVTISTSWIAPRRLIEERDFAEITSRARRFVHAVTP